MIESSDMKDSFRKEVPGLAITVARLGIAERMARKVRRGESTEKDMVGFVAADIFDGVALRQFDLDTPIRRAADGIVDQVSIARIAYEVAKKHPAARPYIGVLAVRTAIVSAMNGYHFLKTGEVTKGSSRQKAVSLASAAFALIAQKDSSSVTHIAGTVTSAISLATAVSYAKGIGKTHDGGIRRV